MNGIAASIVAVEALGVEAVGEAAPDFFARHRTVSVVMVAFMTGPALAESIACALRDQLVDELVVVDNGSTPADAASLRALAERDPRVVLLSGQGNVGFARAANLGGFTPDSNGR